jgi:hypothetical protein
MRSLLLFQQIPKLVAVSTDAATSHAQARDSNAVSLFVQSRLAELTDC